MAKINFPSNPVNGQVFDQNGVYYYYDATVGAWLTSIIPRPLDVSNTFNTQIVFNDDGVSNGSYGLVFNKTSNTAIFNNVAVTQNVSAIYYYGNGSFLTGVSPPVDLTAANNWSNTKVAAVTSNSTSRIWANTVDSAGIETVYLDLATSGVTATIYGGATNIPAITVDAYGRITSASNVAVSSGGLTVGDQTSSSSTFYPLFTTTTSGSASDANVATTKLYFVPSTGTLSATVFNSLSDIQFKTDIQEFDGKELINNIDPVTFTWKDTGGKSYGVIAQDLEQILPELVQTVDGIKSVSYIPMIAILIDVVKKQGEEIEKLKTLLNNQKVTE